MYRGEAAAHRTKQDVEMKVDIAPNKIYTKSFTFCHMPVYTTAYHSITSLVEIQKDVWQILRILRYVTW